MRAYTVHAPPGEAPAPERFAFVKDGFSWPALLVPILFILWHRLWLTLMGAVIFVLVIAWIDRLFGEDNAAMVAIIGVLLFALEANNLRRLSFEARGWRELGSAFGQDRDEAEIRFFVGWPKNGGAPRAKGQSTPAAPPPTRDPDDERILGLFPEPER
jgi:hypothetical protein